VLHLLNDPLVYRGLSGSGVIPRAPNYKDKISGFVDSALFYVIITMTETGAFMEICRREVIPRIEMGGWVSPFFQSNGTEFVVDYAFRWLALHRVSLGVYKGAFDSYKKLWVLFLRLWG